VWEPTYSGARVTSNRWQRWTPSTAGGGWWATGAITATDTLNQYGFPSYTATFAQVKAALPNAVVYAVGVNQGSGVTGLVAGVDQLRVNGTTYDFENAAPTADLGVGITAPPTAPGSTVTATVTVTNAGRSPARDVSTALVVSGGGRVVRAPGGITFGQITAFRTPTLGVGASVTYVVSLAVDRATRGPLTLFAGTHSAVPDPRPANNSARATVPVWAPRPLPAPQPGPGPLPGPYPGSQPGPHPGPHPGALTAPQPGPLTGPQPGPRPGPQPAGPAAAPAAALVPGPRPAPVPAPGAAPRPASVPAPAGAAQPAPQPKAAPAPPPAAAPAPAPQPAAASVAQPAAASVAQPAAASVAQPALASVPQPVAAPAAAPQPAPVAAPTS
jgi:Domain of unknown function DUF11